MNETQSTINTGLSLGAESPFQFMEKIATEYGTPTFVFWEQIFRENCRRFKNEFSLSGRRTISSYSYKTNNVKALCAIAHTEGYGAEVVSASELDMAEQLGVEGERIFYNGPLKSEASLQKAIAIGAAIHIDSLSELSLVILLARSMKTTARIAFRITPETGERYGPVWNKFGLSCSENEVQQALAMVASAPKQVCLKGLHMHMGTNLSDPTLYGNIAHTMIKVVAMAESQLGYEIDYVDIGGGFSAPSGSIPMTAHPEEWVPISLSEVANGVSKILDQFDPQQRLSVVTEPGRLLAESSFSFLTRIVSIKRRGTRSNIILDGGTNIVPSAYYTKHPVSFPGKENLPLEGKADLHGPLCTQFDVVASEVNVPRLIPGDFVLIHSAGAYTYTFSSQFVGPRPPVVLVTEQGKTILVRMKEPSNVLWQYDRLPED